jgi:hypothetical protein
MKQDRSIYNYDANWIEVNGLADNQLSKRLFDRLTSRINSGKFIWENVGYIQDVSLKAAGKNFEVSEKSLEKLRRACQLWDVDIKLKDISSHRKFIGPVIVTAKKLIFPILKAFLKDSLHQQRAFNAAILAVCLDLYDKKKNNSETIDTNEK